VPTYQKKYDKNIQGQPCTSGRAIEKREKNPTKKKNNHQTSKEDVAETTARSVHGNAGKGAEEGNSAGWHVKNGVPKLHACNASTKKTNWCRRA